MVVLLSCAVSFAVLVFVIIFIMRAKYPDRKVWDVGYNSRKASITAYRVLACIL